MKTAVVVAKMDAGVKARVQKIAAKNGVTLSFLISQHFRKIDQNREIPSADFIPNRETVRAIHQTEKDLKNGKHGPVAHNVQELREQLENL